MQKPGPAVVLRSRRPFSCAFAIASIASIAVALASGCSSSGGSAPSTHDLDARAMIGTSAVSGTRLRVRSLVGSGAREVIGFHDTVRNEDCTFQRAEGGRTRCLPSTLPATPDGTFADAACKIPNARVFAPLCGGDVGRYAILYDGGDCRGALPKELRMLSGAVASHYALGPTGCAATAKPPAGGTTVQLGYAVDWSSFVEAVETVVPGDALSEKVLVASDGARQHLGFYDEKHHVDCAFELMADGVTRCVTPLATRGGLFYADAACSTPLVGHVNAGASGCSTTGERVAFVDVVVEPSLPKCGGSRNVYAVDRDNGQSDGAAIFYVGVDPAGTSSTTDLRCVAGGTVSSQDNSLVAVTENITASLPSTPRVSSAGSDRLVPAFVPSPTPDTLVAGWHDRETDLDCSFALATDGKMRCLPTGGKAAIFFTDDACKAASQVAVLDGASCAGAPGAPRHARVATDTCPPQTRIVAISGDARSLPVASAVTSTGTCGKIARVSGAFDAAEVDPSMFVDGVLTVE